MTHQVYFEDVKEGQEIPSLEKHPSSQTLALWAAASGDFYQIHYDKDFALSTGLPGTIVHGALKHAFLGDLLHRWVAPAGRIKRLAVTYRGMDLPGAYHLKGMVLRKHQQHGQNLVELQVWGENAAGQVTTPGTAMVTLPSRG